MDRLPDSGVDFVHHPFRTAEKHLPEINSGCVALLDHDGDGDLDLYFGQGVPLPGSTAAPADARDRLYRNDGNFRFTDVTEETHASEDGYTYHAAAADHDGDGDVDLYLANFGANRLLRNDGGVFHEVPDAAGAATARWSAVSAFADFDQDGDLDLYVGNYCEYPLDHAGCTQVLHGERVRSYCNPDEFPGAPDQLFRNDGGVFVDVTAEAGMADSAGTALGLVVSDYDGDGDVDLFVSNDGRPNFLWRNDGGLRFTDVAWDAGVAVANNGLSEACMGTDFADVDADGDFDLLVANLAMETNTFYLNCGGLFEDKSVTSGLGPPSLRFVGFGAEFFDFDNDADQDLMVANGHVLDNVQQIEPAQTFRQPPQLYVNDGSAHFTESGAGLGAYFTGQYVGRGLAVGDLDDDGDLDVVVAHNGGPPAILENRRGSERHWIGFLLRGTGSNRAAIGARVTVESAGRRQIEEVRGTSSYGAFSDLRVHFGLGDASSLERATIRWPTGETTELGPLAADRYHTVHQDGQ